MRLALAIALTAALAARPSLAQNAPPAPEPMSPASAQSEDALSGKTPAKGEQGGEKKPPEGTETGWGGQWKMPDEGKAEASRNEVEGQGVKQPEQGK
jgi:hypothetical protein